MVAPIQCRQIPPSFVDVICCSELGPPMSVRTVLPFTKVHASSPVPVLVTWFSVIHWQALLKICMLRNMRKTNKKEHDFSFYLSFEGNEKAKFQPEHEFRGKAPSTSTGHQTWSVPDGEEAEGRPQDEQVSWSLPVQRTPRR